MRNRHLLAGVAFTVLVALAHGAGLRNNDFSASSGASIAPWRLFGDPAVASAIRSDEELPEGMPAKAIVRNRSGLGGILQFVDAQDYRGKVMRLHGWLKVTGDEPHSVGLWLRADDAQGNTLSLENMADHRVTATSPWREHKISLYIPNDAVRLRVGVLISGSATVEAGQMQLELPQATAAQAAAPISPLLAEIMAAIQAESLRYTPSSEPMLQEIISQSPERNSDDPNEARAIGKLMLHRLGDQHSTFMPAPPRDAAEVRPTVASFPQPELHTLSREVSVLALPPFGSATESDSNIYAAAGAKALRRAKPQCGWIIDLRFNSGGNMWPMLAAMAELLPEGTIGQFIDRVDQSTPWIRNRDRISSGGESMKLPLRTAQRAIKLPVAVVIGPSTASSGEAVAIALKSVPGVRFFGQPTAGLTTANKPVKLRDGSTLMLETSRFADAAGRTYTGRLVPDERISLEASISAAAAWLAARCHAVPKPH
ncbi:S41 family peptidase [Roseateles sp.]|uniref:S41 family peptidase n=1 Tax=Roseateles sp. TaxID=1971397 RepID=UPI003BAB7160